MRVVPQTEDWEEVVNEGLEALDMGSYKKAEGCLTRALAISLRTRHRLGRMFIHLTTLYLAQGRLYLIDELLKEVLNQGKELDSRWIADTHRLYGLYFEMVGEKIKARQAFADALSLCEGPDTHPQALLTVLRDFSWFSLRQGQERARTMFKRGLELAERQHCPNHPSLISFLNGVARCDLEQNRCVRAEQMIHRATALATLAELDEGHPHPDLALCLESLALLYQQQQTLSPGVAKQRKIPLPVSLRFQQAADHVKQWISPHHPDRVAILISLSRWELQLGNREQGRAALEEAEEAAGALPEKHPLLGALEEVRMELEGRRKPPPSHLAPLLGGAGKAPLPADG